MIVLVARVAFELLADFEAAELRHHDIEQDEMRLERRHFVQRILAIDRDGRFDIETCQIRFEQLDVRLVVVGDQNATFFLAFIHGDENLPQRTQRAQRSSTEANRKFTRPSRWPL